MNVVEGRFSLVSRSSEPERPEAVVGIVEDRERQLRGILDVLRVDAVALLTREYPNMRTKDAHRYFSATPEIPSEVMAGFSKYDVFKILFVFYGETSRQCAVNEARLDQERDGLLERMSRNAETYIDTAVEGKAIADQEYPTTPPSDTLFLRLDYALPAERGGSINDKLNALEKSACMGMIGFLDENGMNPPGYVLRRLDDAERANLFANPDPGSDDNEGEENPVVEGREGASEMGNGSHERGDEGSEGIDIDGGDSENKNRFLRKQERDADVRQETWERERRVFVREVVLPYFRDRDGSQLRELIGELLNMKYLPRQRSRVATERN